MGDEALRSAAGIEPAAPAAFSLADSLTAPVFRGEFVSKAFPELNGQVVVRYPTFSDLLEIERQTAALGGGAVAEWLCTLRRCLEQAPAGWFKVTKDSAKPTLNADFPDGDALQGFYGAFLVWRRWVREGGLRAEQGGT